MEIQLNETSARDMALRLRTAVGEDNLPQSKAFEALSQALGFKNWDTLSGVLKKNESHRPKGFALDKPVDLFMACTTTSDYPVPDYCKVSLTVEFIERMLQLQRQCNELDLSEVREWNCAAQWGGKDADMGEGEDWRMDTVEFAVGKASMWFSAEPKHASYRIESRSIDIALLVKALETGKSPDEYLVWHDGRLLHESTSDMNYFVQVLTDAGEF